MNISTIIPAHNAAETIAETIASLQVQTSPNWEAIIIDDGSTDQTVVIATEFAAKDKRIRIISQPHQGASAARNIGIDLANFDWLLFLDADDWISPEYIEKMSGTIATDSNLDAVWCGARRVTPDGSTFLEQYPDPDSLTDLFPVLAHKCAILIHTCVVRKALVEAVGKFDTGLRTAEDWDLWQRISRTGARFGRVEEVLAFYRMRPNSLSRDTSYIFADHMRVITQGHSRDPRVPNPHPSYVEGQPIEALGYHRLGLSASFAGFFIGRGQDAEHLLEQLADDCAPNLEPSRIAQRIFWSVLVSTCLLPTAWEKLWPNVETYIKDFLVALEVQSQATGLARRTCNILERMILQHCQVSEPLTIGTTYGIRLDVTKPIPDICLTTGAERFYSILEMEGTEVGNVQLPIFDRLVASKVIRDAISSQRIQIPSNENQPELIKHQSEPVTPISTQSTSVKTRYHGRAFFETLFSSQPDPWKYTIPYEQTKYEQTLSLVPSRQIGKALELACAEGHFTVQLAPRVDNLLAADISQIAIERCASRCSHLQNINFQQLDMLRDPLPGQFDFIVCSEVLYLLENVEELKIVADKIADALEPGGYLLMANAHLIVDEPDKAGFNWGHQYGGKVVGDTFASIQSLRLIKEIWTPLYRVQLFQRNYKDSLTWDCDTPELVKIAEQPTPLPPGQEDFVQWQGGQPRVRSTPKPVFTENLPILMYHRVAPTGSAKMSRYRVTPEAFEEQLRYLRDAGFYSVAWSDWQAAMVARRPLPGRAIAITFDDGYTDFLHYAWPLLKQYGFTATVFLVTELIGSSNSWDKAYGEEVSLMSWSEILQLQDEGVEFGSHSATHNYLTSLSPTEVLSEATRSRNMLQSKLGVPIHTFAYPYGEFDPVIQQVIGACGYTFGLSCRSGLSQFQDELLALPRIEIMGSDGLKEFVAKLSPKN
jgi:glycosyltransferase involved in cell wall biosynthesis/peptidoglycan/xylan/chitin deacetylase (PgdA/CDA1 family)/SAM-dependent methyltransferase